MSLGPLSVSCRLVLTQCSKGSYTLRSYRKLLKGTNCRHFQLVVSRGYATRRVSLDTCASDSPWPVSIQPTITDKYGNVNNLLNLRDHGGVYVLAIDQGTQSTRVILYDRHFQPVLLHQEPLRNITPQPGWVEQDPMEIMQTTMTCLRKIVEKAKGSGIELDSVKLRGIGIANQRETTILWDSTSGKPLFNSIVWNDIRTEKIVEEMRNSIGQDHFRAVCGLPISTYFSALKIRWLMDNVPEVQTAIKAGTCKFGTVDTWLIWNLTGGPRGGIHVTDITNASRTMLLNLKTGQWDEKVAKVFKIPLSILPAIKSSAEIYGNLNLNLEESLLSLLHKVPICGCLGDQQAALVGQMGFEVGDVKSTYGTGCFMLINTGKEVVQSSSGLLTTVGYQLGPSAPITYALEGSIAIAGQAVSWLKDNLGMINNVQEIAELAGSVNSNGGVFFVPALTGLFAPHWRSDARGLIYGLTLHSTKAHIARALLEAICFQTREIIDSAQADSKANINKLLVDGGMTKSDFLLQLQADIANLTVVRPADIETTARGAAIAAGITVGLWRNYVAKIAAENNGNHNNNNNTDNNNNNTNNNNNNNNTNSTFIPKMDVDTRDKLYSGWKKAVKLSFGDI